MALVPGTRIGPYEIQSALGAGGMGEVYRARDTRLKRDVALKFLPDAFSGDPDRLARFQREAEVLAALNHPNIAHVHGLEDATPGDGRAPLRALVMELVDGEDLSSRLARGAMPADEALPIARQIAIALEAAHDHGIVHRDLKPANVKVTPDGTVKVLDFGLAKAIESSRATSVDAANSPTLSLGGTEAGVILGTAGYMSPEQARGRAVDRRADIWAFGVVLLEMLSGRRVFDGETTADTIAKVLAGDPDWAILPPATPVAIRSLVRRCLTKDPRQRLQAIGEARIAIDAAASDTAASDLAPPPPRRRRELAVLAIAALLVVVAVIQTLRLSRQPAADVYPVRFHVEANSIGVSSTGVLSPDGRRLAVRSGAGALRVIVIHSLESGQTTVLPGTEGAQPSLLTWSPDSRFIAFATEGRLRKIAVAGGPSQVICELPRALPTVSWGPGDTILIGGMVAPTLLRVSANGGEPVAATVLDPARRENNHRLPSFLPDGRHFFFTATWNGQERQAYVGRLDSDERKALPNITSEVKFSAGHILFLRDGTLMAQRFDERRLELVGEAVAVVEERLAPANLDMGPFSVSANGSLAYGPSARLGITQLTWFDRAGKPLGTVGAASEIGDIELSADDRFVTFEAGTPGDIWVMDLSRGVSTRVTTDQARDADPVWAPDGKSIAFRGDRDGGHMYRRAFGVVGDDQLLLKSGARDSPSSWSGDGQYLAFDRGNDVWALPLTGGAKPFQVTATPFAEQESQISPDGRWIAYESNESGQVEIHIQSFPQPGVKRQVSIGGGTLARWRADSHELYYVAADGWFMAVGLESAAGALEISAAQRLFQPRLLPNAEGVYALSSGGRFLINVPTEGDRLSTSITVVLNWTAGLPK